MMSLSFFYRLAAWVVLGCALNVVVMRRLGSAGMSMIDGSPRWMYVTSVIYQALLFPICIAFSVWDAGGLLAWLRVTAAEAEHELLPQLPHIILASYFLKDMFWPLSEQIFAHHMIATSCALVSITGLLNGRESSASAEPLPPNAWALGALFMEAGSLSVNLKAVWPNWRCISSAHVYVMTVSNVGGAWANAEVKICFDLVNGTQARVPCYWSYGEAFYFSVATVSTVGYGDYAPDTGAARVFTAFYILMGVFIVFSRLGSILDAIFDSCYYVFNLRVYKAIRWLKRWCRGTPPDAKKEQGEEQGEEGVVALQPTWRFYTEQIGTTLLVGIIFSLVVSAWVFVQLQPGLSYSDAVWHCWVTSTTVGYGDIGLVTDQARSWASVHILLSTAWLVRVANQVGTAQSLRSFQLKRQRSIGAQLSPDLIDALDRKGKGEVFRQPLRLDGSARFRKVNMLEFVIGMLIAMDAEVCGQTIDWETDVAPLIARFTVLDRDHSGSLDRTDLAFMVDQARKKAENLGLTEGEKKAEAPQDVILGSAKAAAGSAKAAAGSAISAADSAKTVAAKRSADLSHSILGGLGHGFGRASVMLGRRGSVPPDERGRAASRDTVTPIPVSTTVQPARAAAEGEAAGLAPAATMSDVDVVVANEDGAA